MRCPMHWPAWHPAFCKWSVSPWLALLSWRKSFLCPALGIPIVDSVLYRDTPMIHATILFLAFFLVICNTVSDILQRIFQRGHSEGVVQ